MSIVKATSHKAKSAGRQISYAIKEEKTTDESGRRYVEGFGGICSPERASQEFKMNKEHWEKTDGRQCCHFVNSFPGREVTPEQAMNLTRELIERDKRFQGFQGVMACHCNTENIHVHIVVDSVNVETGKKFQMSPHDYKDFKKLNQEICQEHGLSVTPLEKNPENIRADDIKKYKAMERGNSEIEQCFQAVQECKSIAQNKADFERLMREKGYSTTWQDNRKYITFQNLETGKKFRNKNLEKTFQVEMGKETLAHAFEENRLRETTGRSAEIRERAGLDRHSQRREQANNFGESNAEIDNRDAKIDQLKAEQAERRIAEIKRERERIAERERAVAERTREVERSR